MKRGADGVVVDGEAFPAVPTEVVDATGAGDAFAAGFLVGGVEARARGGGPLLREARGDAVIRVAEEVRAALADGRGVVALETTLVAHGFPPGEGVEVGLASERAVRDGGSVPATIGILDGEIVVGLTEGELGALRRVGAQDRPARRRRGGRCRARSARRRSAARSPSARRPGIRFMATGGLGGVHRGWPTPPDVSADLGALARTQALVVSSGVKSLLDVPATAELLETLGVPVLGWRTDDAAALLRRDAAARRCRRASSRRTRRRGSRRRTGSSAAAACCSAARRTRASTTSSR